MAKLEVKNCPGARWDEPEGTPPGGSCRFSKSESTIERVIREENDEYSPTRVVASTRYAVLAVLLVKIRREGDLNHLKTLPHSLRS
ncbi:hypothetical protein [Haladaptatus sp. T7]|uniref:hypothetical protein n=1 Tax=Haladaptatus sp. T7 TaxID=2029368 RepID=UPI0022303F95|nr:hypothetical protein [Haladaptatus sp. T7]